MRLDVAKPLLDLNDRLAAENRALFDARGVFVLDLLASPGAGKTSTILATIQQLRERFSIAVIEGDIASDVDSRRIKEQGIPAVQINTGGACHLESQMIRRALDVLDLEALDLIVIENVGNLVCPTDFYLGEDLKVMILSVPEGHDKPLKYPGIFQAATAIILNKIDTMPVFDFDERAFRESVRQLNPSAPIFPMSATSGQGIELWTRWLTNRVESVARGHERESYENEGCGHSGHDRDSHESEGHGDHRKHGGHGDRKSHGDREISAGIDRQGAQTK